MDRDAFLDRVRNAVLAAALPESSGVSAELPALEDTDLVALFTERARSVDAVVHGPISHHRVPETVTGIAAGHHASSFMAWEDLPAVGIISALATAGLSRVDHQVPAVSRVEHQTGYYHLDLGVTGADAGLAESGSIVLSHGPGRPRMASLVPAVHIALLETSRIHRTLAHWAGRYPEAVSETANLVAVTGPSRTGDIELQLNLGVHGPRSVHVVLMQ